jgi:hypothetical protein
VEGIEDVAVNFFRAVVFGLLVSAALAEPLGWAPNLTTTATWDSNASNADRSADVIGALQLRSEFAAATRLALDTDNALLLGGHLVAEAWPRFQGLDQVSFGPRLTWQHKFGLGALAPVFALELGADLLHARMRERNAVAGTAALVWRKRLDEATRLILKQEFARRDTRELLFDRTGAESSFELDRELDENWSLSFTARWRHGDVLAYATPPRPDLVALAHAREAYDVFHRPFVAYSVETHSLGGSLAASRALARKTWLLFCYEWRETNRQPLHYVNHLVSAALVHQF